MQLQHSNSASWRNAMYRYQHSMFPEGTAHHAAETGKVEALEAAVAAGEALGYPSSVTLQSRDEILQCMPLHVAAECGHNDAVKVHTCLSAASISRSCWLACRSSHVLPACHSSPHLSCISY